MTQKIIVVRGLRGIGKTTLARGYVSTFQNDYEHILWVNSSRKTIFETVGNNISLQKNLDLQFDKNISFQERYELVCNKLQEIKSKVLIVIDNANSDLCKISVLEKLPLLSNFRILITSNYEFPNEVFQWLLKELEVKDAIELFKSISEISNNEGIIKKIIEITFSHTLTIELLASIFKSHRGITLEQIYEKLEGSLANIPVIKVHTKYNREEDDTYFLKCLDIFFDISEINAQENRKLLSYFSLFSQATISYSTLKTILEISNEREELELNTQINELIEQGWIIAFSNDLFSCHGLIQQLIIEKETPTYLKYKYIIDNISKIIDIENPIIKPELLDILNISIAVNETLYKYDKNIDSLEVIANNFNRIGNIYYDYEKYNNSLPFYEKTINIRVNELKKEDLELGRAYTNYALSLGGLKDFDNALKYLLVSLEVKKRCNYDEKMKLSLAVTFLNFAHIYNIKGSFQETIPYYRKGSKLLTEYYNKDFGQLIEENNDYVAIILNNVAFSLNKLKKFNCALKFSKKAIKVDEHRYPDKKNIDIARTYMTYADIQTNLQNFNDAALYIKKAITIFRKHYTLKDDRYKEALSIQKKIKKHFDNQ